MFGRGRTSKGRHELKRWLKLAAGAAALTLMTAGCAGSGGSDTAASSTGTLTVWLMSGSAPTTLTDELNKEFETAHPGVKVRYEVQQWNGIQQKLTTALAGDNPPDVIEIGNTQTPAFASQGVLADLS